MKYQAYTRHNFLKMPAHGRLTPEQVKAISIVSEVLPFKTNNYVVNELIDWDNYEEDPMFILNFPQKAMLKTPQFNTLTQMVENGSSKTDGEKLPGIQHK